MSMQTTVRKPRKSKRESILQAAMRVFCYYGFDGSTLDKIAGEAGVSKSLVIKYYGTQKEMVVICLKRFLEDFFDKAQKNAERKGMTYEGHLDYVFELFKMSRPQIRLLLSLTLTPAHEDISREIISEYMDFTQNLLRHFPDACDASQHKELNYTMYALLVAYTIGGNEDNFRRARAEVLAHYQIG